MRAVFVLAGKDLRQRLRDRSFFIMGILAPLALSYVLSLVLGGALETGFDPVYVVVDEDMSATSAQITGTLDEIGFETVAASTKAAGLAMIDDGEASAGFVLPAGFGDAVATNQEIEITVLGNQGAGIATLVAQAIAEGVAGEISAVQLSVGSVLAAGGGDQTELAQSASARPNALVLTDDVAGTRQLDAKTYFAVSIATFFLFFTVQDSVLSILEERRQGTMSRLLAAPIKPVALLVGKSLSSLVGGLFSMVVLVLATTLLLGASWGNPIGVAILSVAGVLAAMGVGLIVGSFAKTAEQAQQFAAIVAVTLGFLGGVFFPITQTEGILASVSRLTPHFWLVRGFGDNAGVGTLADVLVATGWILVFAVLTLGVGVMRRSRLGVEA